MIVKTTSHRSYPKPDVNNSLQDDVANIEHALDMIDTDVQDVNTKIETLKGKIYSTAYDIIGPPSAFQYARDLTYSIEIPDATAYLWTATGVTITSNAAEKSITIKTANTSGSVSVNVTTAAGDTVQKTKAITVNQFSNIQTFNYTGSIQSWTVPANVELIRLEAWGAMGCAGYDLTTLRLPGGKGARMKGVFPVTPRDKLLILVGGKGYMADPANTNANLSGAGGGGSFVVKVDNNSAYQMTVGGLEKVTPLLIAGGGGGGGTNKNGQIFEGGHGLVSPSGGDVELRAGGSNGSGGDSYQYAGGGAGFLGNGTFAQGATQPKSFLNGGAGGTYIDRAKSNGGFGGGGGSGAVPGGGGGYSGGASDGVWPNWGRSGGGGSYNTGMDQNNSPGARDGDGKVEISW